MYMIFAASIYTALDFSTLLGGFVTSQIARYHCFHYDRLVLSRRPSSSARGQTDQRDTEHATLTDKLHLLEALMNIVL